MLLVVTTLTSIGSRHLCLVTTLCATQKCKGRFGYSFNTSCPLMGLRNICHQKAFIHWCIHSLNKYLLSICYAPGTVIKVGDVSMDKWHYRVLVAFVGYYEIRRFVETFPPVMWLCLCSELNIWQNADDFVNMRVTLDKSAAATDPLWNHCLCSLVGRWWWEKILN